MLIPAQFELKWSNGPPNHCARYTSADALITASISITVETQIMTQGKQHCLCHRNCKVEIGFLPLIQRTADNWTVGDKKSQQWKNSHMCCRQNCWI